MKEVVKRGSPIVVQLATAVVLACSGGNVGEEVGAQQEPISGWEIVEAPPSISDEIDASGLTIRDETLGDAIGNHCGDALDVGNLGVDETASIQGTIPPGDYDWFKVTFSGANCDFNPRIDLNDFSGKIRLWVVHRCVGDWPSGQMSCDEGQSWQIRNWTVRLVRPCGDRAWIDPSSSSFNNSFDDDGVVYVGVYAIPDPPGTQSSEARLPYVVDFRN